MASPRILTAAAAVDYMSNTKNVNPGTKVWDGPNFGELGVKPDNNAVRPQQILAAAQVGLTAAERTPFQSINSVATTTNLGGRVTLYPNNKVLSAPVVSFGSTGQQGATNKLDG